jgi:hypothetical protein
MKDEEGEKNGGDMSGARFRVSGISKGRRR